MHGACSYPFPSLNFNHTLLVAPIDAKGTDILSALISVCLYAACLVWVMPVRLSDDCPYVREGREKMLGTSAVGPVQTHPRETPQIGQLSRSFSRIGSSASLKAR